MDDGKAVCVHGICQLALHAVQLRHSLEHIGQIRTVHIQQRRTTHTRHLCVLGTRLPAIAALYDRHVASRRIQQRHRVKDA